MLQNQLRFWLIKLNSSFQIGPNNQVLSDWTSGVTAEQWQQWHCSPVRCWAPSARGCATGAQGKHPMGCSLRCCPCSHLAQQCPTLFVSLWNPCLLTEFWNCPLRLILCRALPWGALIKLPISPAEDCNFPCDVKRKLRTAVAKETAEAKWNGLLTMSLGNT